MQCVEFGNGCTETVTFILTIMMQWFVIASLGALFEHTAQGHHWLVAELEFASLPQAVYTLGVDSPLEPEGWTVVSRHLTPRCLLH